MIMIVGVVALLPLMWIGGGNPARIAEVHLSHRRYAVIGLLTQVVILESPLAHGSQTVLGVVHLASYGLLGVFLYRNREVGGFTVLGLGGLLNFAAIAANGGVMPATASAAARAGIPASDAFANSAVASHPPLWFLGDVFAIPAGIPFANVFSVGDVCIVAGAGLFMWHASRPHDNARGVGDAPDATVDEPLDDVAERLVVLQAIVTRLESFDMHDDRLGAVQAELSRLAPEGSRALRRS